MDNLCTSCLCTGRKLYTLSETGFEHLYTQILNEIPVYNMSQLCIRICWECKAMLRKVANFKEQAKTCYMELLQYAQRNTIKQFSSFSNLQNHQNYIYSYPKVPQVKEEVEDYSFIDDNVSCNGDDMPVNDDDVMRMTEALHCEPETFVNDLNIDKIKKRKSRKEDENTIKQFSSCSNLQNHQNYIFSYPKVPQVKEEVENYSFIDDNVSCNGDDMPVNDDDVMRTTEALHCEPETFVNDLNIDKIKKRKSRKEDKLTKHKSRNPKKPKISKRKGAKSKVKLKKTSSDVSQNKIKTTVESLIDSTVVDCYNKEDLQDERNREKEQNMEEDIDVADNVELDQNNDVNITVKVPRNYKLKNNVPKVMSEPLTDKPICTECGKTFSSRKTYRYHLNVLHKGQNRYPCPRCGKVYQWKSNLGRHIRSHKARDSGELYCETCDKRFASVATFRQHLRISRRHVSESEFSFTCNECGKKFVNKTRLRDHIDWEHLKKIKFKCQLCNKPFKCHTSLYVHMQNVHRSKDKKDNLCHVCGKSYQNAAKLKYHIVAMHTSETPYQCEQCSAAFGWYSSLYRHVREVHYKIKVQPKKSKKQKKSEVLPSLLPVLPPIHHSGQV